MQQIIVGENDQGQRLDSFLLKTFDNMPSSMMYRAIRKKDIRVNGKRCKINQIVNKNDEISIYMHSDFLKRQPVEYNFLKALDDLDIVYQDDNMMLVNKPIGLLCHSDIRNNPDTLINRVHKYLYNTEQYEPKKEQSFSPALVNRIDRNTSGIVIVGKNAKSLRFLNKKMRQGEIRRIYNCVVYGYPEKKQAMLEGYWQKTKRKNKVTISQKNKDGEKVRTFYRVLGEKHDLSLLEVELITGRSHQIRAHLASMGHPIVGDGKYSSNNQNQSVNIKYQALCSYKLVFEFNKDSQEAFMSYLDKQTFKLNDVWFIPMFWQGELKK